MSDFLLSFLINNDKNKNIKVLIKIFIINRKVIVFIKNYTCNYFIGLLILIFYINYKFIPIVSQRSKKSYYLCIFIDFHNYDFRSQ